MSKTIFQINDELMSVFQELEDNGGELTPQLEETLKNGGEAITSKVKSMCNYIEYLKSDKELIDKEIDRLKTLKKSKDNSISNITKLVVWAVESFGIEDKKGKQWIDWSTGKVSVRPSKSLEVYQDKIDAIADYVNATLTGAVFTNCTNNIKSIDVNSMIDCLEHNQDEDGNLNPIEIEESDLSAINVDVTMTVPLTEIMSGKALNTTINIMDTTNIYKLKAYTDKYQLKESIDNGIGTNLGEIKYNKSLNIR